jgi:transposase
VALDTTDVIIYGTDITGCQIRMNSDHSHDNSWALSIDPEFKMPNNLNLARYNVLGTKETDHDLHIDAETVSQPKTCLACGSENIVGGGRQEILIKDTPMYGKRVGIYVKARRMRCLDCGKTLTERLPDVADGQRMTTRLYRWIAARSTFPRNTSSCS